MIVGAQWGDEGKGKIVDLLAQHSDLVCRYNGGPNAGHTIVADGETYKLKHIPSGIIGNVFTYSYNGKQFVGVYSGIGGWAGIGMAAGLEKDTDGLGAVGGYRELNKYTQLGGVLTVFALP